MRIAPEISSASGTLGTETGEGIGGAIGRPSGATPGRNRQIDRWDGRDAIIGDSAGILTGG
jgi:hypothetical protein